jgi:hypothetical protein
LAIMAFDPNAGGVMAMASALAAIFVRQGWARSAARFVRSLREPTDRPPPVPAVDQEEFRTLCHVDRESALLDAILRGYLKL